MSFFSGNKRRKNRIWIVAAVVILLVIIGFCTVYLNDYYRADMDAIVEFGADKDVLKKVLEDNTIVYEAEDMGADVQETEGLSTGFIFYPGGKVEYTAYEPMMKALASEGITSVLLEMPFNLAVFDVNAAEGIQELYPEIEKWYIGGHSLGGSMAASYLSENTDDFEGLILLGSYSTADLSESALEVLSIYGSEDKVLNAEKYLEYKSNLPFDFTEVVIDGGCHAYFGMYGAQEGDGVPAVTNEEQIEQTVDAIEEFMN